MPRIADYNAFSDGIRSLPNANGDIDFDLEFDAPSVDAGARSVLAFLVQPIGPATLEVTLNGTIILQQDFDGEPQKKSYHELIDPNLLLALNNRLTLTKTAGSGRLRLSDFVVFFQANI